MIDGYHEKNLKNIKQVCKGLDISYHIVDLNKQFKKEVFKYFIDTYKDGATPNPCVRCNRHIKFGALIDKAVELNCDMLATGHYVKTDGRFIYEAYDKQKDQSYFLAQVLKENLKFLHFPLQETTKEQVKNIAKDIKFLKDISTNNESQEICFVQNSYIDVLNTHIKTDIKGDTINKSGTVIGTHKGYMHYTIGKRKGFTVHGALTPHYVSSISKEHNTITVGDKKQLRQNKVYTDSLNMFIDDTKFECEVRLRYRSNKQKCAVSIQNDKATIMLQEIAYGVARGQYAVFYQNDKILGSGVITKSEWQDDIWQD